MKTALYLTKILLKNGFTDLTTKRSKREKQSNSSATLIIVFVVLIGMVAAPMAFMGFSYGMLFKQYNLLLDIFKLLIPVASIMVIFFSIFTFISVFYLSSDIESLLSMPLKPWQILLAKFLNALISVYLIELMMLTPILFGIGVGAQCNLLYFLNTLIITIVLPIFPLSILGILTVSVMRYSALSKMKDKMQYVIMAFALIFAFSMQIFTSAGGTALEGSEEEIIALIQNSLGNTANLLSSIMFFTYPASLALGLSNIFYSILWILAFIAVSLLGLTLFLWVGEKTYIKGILGKPQLKIKKKKEDKVVFVEEKNNNLFINLVSNEWRTMWRSPVFNMNLISTVIIVPIVLVFSFFVGMIESGEELNIGELLSSLKGFVDFNSGYVMAFTIAILSFFTSFAMVASTAISRDGKYAWINKVIPVKPMTIINAKVFWGIVLGFIPVLFITLLGLVVGLFNVLDFLLINIPLFLLVVFVNYIGIIIDLRRPKLDWDDEHTAVKNNVNGLFFMLIDWAVTALIVGIGVVLLFINIPGFITSIILSLIFLVGCVIIYKLLENKGLSLFDKIG